LLRARCAARRLRRQQVKNVRFGPNAVRQRVDGRPKKRLLRQVESGTTGASAALVFRVIGSLLLLLVGCGTPDANGLRDPAGAGGSTGVGGHSSHSTPPTLGPAPVAPDSPSSEAEPHVAVTPGGRVAIAWILRGQARNSIGYRLSEDRGESWGPVRSIEPEGELSSGDPTLAAHPNGDLWLGWLTGRRDAQSNRVEAHVLLARATPDQASFGEPIELTDPDADALYDQPRLHVRGDGRILVSYMQYPKTADASAIVVASSDDGERFRRATVASGPGMRNLAFVCSSPESERVYVRYFDTERGIVLARSDDGGTRFSPDGIAVQSDEESDRIARTTPGCVANGSDVWVMYGVSSGLTGIGENDLLSAIRLAHSSDGGASVGARHDLHDATGGSLYMTPELAADSTGRLFVAYYAGRAGDDPRASFRAAGFATPDKLGISRSIVSPVSLTTLRSSPSWLGDYVGLAWRDGQLYAAVVDNSSGTGHVVFWRGDPP
jgi:hypothetical protein